MINLVSIKQAERRIRLDIDSSTVIEIPDLEDVIQQASGIILDYLEITIPEQTSPIESSATYELWEEVPAMIPWNVKAATLLVVCELWENREASSADCLSPAVKNLLRRKRLPAMA